MGGICRAGPGLSGKGEKNPKFRLFSDPENQSPAPSSQAMGPRTLKLMSTGPACGPALSPMGFVELSPIAEAQGHENCRKKGVSARLEKNAFN